MTTKSGGAFAQHLARVLGETIIHSSANVAEHKSQVTRNAVDGWLEEAEQHYRPILSALFSYLNDRTDLPPGWAEVVGAMTGPSAQFDVILQILGAIGAIVSGVFALGSIELQPLINELRADYAEVPLSPADLADMVERNIWTFDLAAAEAKLSGVNMDRFNLMVLDTGEPYGVDQALTLWRRGLIDDERLQTVVYYSRVRNEFLPDLQLLAHDTMTAGDALTAALKGVVDPATAQELFAKAGGLATQFDVLLSTAGDAIGVEQALTLYNHGLIPIADAEAVIRHSRINPTFEAMALLLRHKWLGAFQIEAAVKGGAITVTKAIAWLIAEGYTSEQATALVQGSASGKTSTHKEVTEANIATMFEVGAITRTAAAELLVNIGYQPQEVTFILALFDEKRHLTMITAAVNQVRKVYLAGRITTTQATTMLDALTVDAEARTWLIATWKIERASELRELTPAQIGDMYKKGLLTTQEAINRWLSLGYSTSDAALLLGYYGGPPPPTSPAAKTAAANAATSTSATAA